MPQVYFEHQDALRQTPPGEKQIWSYEDVFSAEYRDLFQRNTSLSGASLMIKFHRCERGDRDRAFGRRHPLGIVIAWSAAGNKGCGYTDYRFPERTPGTWLRRPIGIIQLCRFESLRALMQRKAGGRRDKCCFEDTTSMRISY
jgi:hypothetical protein